MQTVDQRRSLRDPPIAGMIVGNSMHVASVTAVRLVQDAGERRARVKGRGFADRDARLAAAAGCLFTAQVQMRRLAGLQVQTALSGSEVVAKGRAEDVEARHPETSACLSNDRALVRSVLADLSRANQLTFPVPGVIVEGGFGSTPREYHSAMAHFAITGAAGSSGSR